MGNGSFITSSDDSIRIKAKVLSRIIRKVFVLLSLSKNQAAVLNRFLKAVLIYVSDKNEEFARRIHAVYFSCLREGERHSKEEDSLVRKCFQECQRFSVAVDTALFRQDHVLSCIARFVFEDRIEQFPLFFCVCRPTTGDQLARFLFDRFKTLDVPFTKLHSVTTTGHAA